MIAARAPGYLTTAPGPARRSAYATDFVHGFSLPDLKARIDVPPGKGVELTLRSLPAGRFIYLCDNFCGEHHDRMNGVHTVV